MSTDMSSVNNTNRIEVITGVQRRRRWTPEQKLELVKQTFEAGMTVSMVARQAGIAATQLFQWKKAYSEGSLSAHYIWKVNHDASSSRLGWRS